MKLESENAELRAAEADRSNDLASKQILEDIMARMNDNQQPTNEGLGADTVAEIVDQRLQQDATKREQDANWDAVTTALSEKYGDFEAADKVVTERSAQLGMTPQEATNLARTNPRVFTELFMAGQSQAPQQSARSAATGTTNMSQAPGGEQPTTRDREYYRNLRKTDPMKWADVKTQRQMWIDLYGTG